MPPECNKLHTSSLLKNASLLSLGKLDPTSRAFYIKMDRRVITGAGFHFSGRSLARLCVYVKN